MKTLSKKQLESIIKNIPNQSIEYSDWDYDEKGNPVGTFENDEYFIRCGIVSVLSYVNIREVFDKDDCSLSLSIDVKLLDIYAETSEAQEVKSTPSQDKQIEKAVFSAIESALK